MAKRLIMQFLLRWALNNLHQKIATRPQHLLAKVNDQSIKVDSLHVINKAVPDKVWYCIRDDKVSFVVVQRLRHLFLRFFFLNVTLDKLDALHIKHLQKVNCYDSLLIFLRFDATGKHLGPSTWCSTDINDFHTRFKQLVLVIDLHQLECSA